MSTGAAVISLQRVEGLTTLASDDVLRNAAWFDIREDVPRLVRRLDAFPGRSAWLPTTREYVVALPWRHREEIVALASICSVDHAEALSRFAVDRARDLGARAAVVVELDEVRLPAFYARIGMEVLDEVIGFELRMPPPPAPSGRFATYRVDPADLASLDHLRRIDHAAFPWLWWNSDAEFLRYGAAPGVEIWMADLAGQPAGYVGFTGFPGWGHLDRVAVHPDAQGQGIGRHLVEFAVGRLHRAGARRVELSTQVDNDRSQELYQRIGFHRRPKSGYRVYGVYF